MYLRRFSIRSIHSTSCTRTTFYRINARYLMRHKEGVRVWLILTGFNVFRIVPTSSFPFPYLSFIAPYFILLSVSFIFLFSFVFLFVSCCFAFLYLVSSRLSSSFPSLISSFCFLLPRGLLTTTTECHFHYGSTN